MLLTEIVFDITAVYEIFHEPFSVLGSVGLSKIFQGILRAKARSNCAWRRCSPTSFVGRWKKEKFKNPLSQK